MVDARELVNEGWWMADGGWWMADGEMIDEMG